MSPQRDNRPVVLRLCVRFRNTHKAYRAFSSSLVDGGRDDGKRKEKNTGVMIL